MLKRSSISLILQEACQDLPWATFRENMFWLSFQLVPRLNYRVVARKLKTFALIRGSEYIFTWLIGICVSLILILFKIVLGNVHLENAAFRLSLDGCNGQICCISLFLLMFCWQNFSFICLAYSEQIFHHGSCGVVQLTFKWRVAMSFLGWLQRTFLLNYEALLV